MNCGSVSRFGQKFHFKITESIFRCSKKFYTKVIMIGKRTASQDKSQPRPVRFADDAVHLVL